MTPDATPPKPGDSVPDAAEGPPRFREYQDAHYHDDDEPVPNNDLGSPRKPLMRKRSSRMLPRRRYQQDD